MDDGANLTRTRAAMPGASVPESSPPGHLSLATEKTAETGRSSRNLREIADVFRNDTTRS